jgi:hypothetical protein
LEDNKRLSILRGAAAQKQDEPNPFSLAEKGHWGIKLPPLKIEEAKREESSETLDWSAESEDSEVSDKEVTRGIVEEALRQAVMAKKC